MDLRPLGTFVLVYAVVMVSIPMVNSPSHLQLHFNPRPRIIVVAHNQFQIQLIQRKAD